MLAIERERAIRLAQQQTNDALESSERSALLLKKQQLLQSFQQDNDYDHSIHDRGNAQEAEQALTQRRASLAATLARLQSESQHMREAEKVYLSRQLTAQTQALDSQRDRERRRSLAERLRETEEAERVVQDQLHALQSERDGHQLSISRAVALQLQQQQEQQEPPQGQDGTVRGKGSEKKTLTESPPAWTSHSQRMRVVPIERQRGPDILQ
jgi:hypothetical protein